MKWIRPKKIKNCKVVVVVGTSGLGGEKPR
jgi:hypothetical protein